MNKILGAGDFPEMLAASDTGRYMQFFDASDKVTKSASAACNRDVIQNFKPPSDMQGVHLTTMGAEEYFGWNRNGDSASVASLRRYHPTFMKHGSVYREHNNKSRRHSIGDIKYETYNEEAKRGELIIWFSKKAAPDMAEKAAKDQELDWSMSMRLPFDRCSVCDNKARNRGQYCHHLKRNMKGFDQESQKYAYARNEDEVKFVDISEVEKKADRIASYLRYISADEDGISKAASADRVIGGSELYDALYGSAAGTPVSIFEQHVLEKIAAVEAQVPQAVLRSFAPRDLSQSQIDVLRTVDFRAVAGQMLKKAMVLPPRTFAAILTGIDIEAIVKDASFDEAIASLPGLLDDIASTGNCSCDGDLSTLINPDPYGTSFTPGGDNIDRLIRDVGENLGMSDADVCGRAGAPDGGYSIVIKSASEDNRSLWDAVVAGYGYYITKVAHELQGRVSLFTLSSMLKTLK